MGGIHTILLVDDDEISNFLTRRILGNLNLGKWIEVRKDGEDAIDYLKECKGNGDYFPDLIFLDMNMPNMNAEQFLAQTKKINFGSDYNPKIILLTSLHHEKVEEFCEKNNLLFLTKPLTQKKLSDFIESSLFIRESN